MRLSRVRSSRIRSFRGLLILIDTGNQRDTWKTWIISLIWNVEPWIHHNWMKPLRKIRWRKCSSLIKQQPPTYFPARMPYQTWKTTFTKNPRNQRQSDSSTDSLASEIPTPLSSPKKLTTLRSLTKSATLLSTKNSNPLQPTSKPRE